MKFVAQNQQVENKRSYAVDISLILKNDKTSINKCFDIIKKFGSISGLKLNEKKTEILHFGQEQSDLPEQAVKILEVKVLNDKSKIKEVNISTKIEKLENSISFWKKRNISLLGRVYITKSMFISQLIQL